MTFIEKLRNNIGLGRPVGQQQQTKINSGCDGAEVETHFRRSFQGERIQQVLTYVSRQFHYYFKSLNLKDEKNKNFDVTEVQSLFVDDPRDSKNRMLLFISTNKPVGLGRQLVKGVSLPTLHSILLPNIRYPMGGQLGQQRADVVEKTQDKIQYLFDTFGHDSWSDPKRQIKDITTYPEFFGTGITTETINDLKDVSRISKFLIDNKSKQPEVLLLEKINSQSFLQSLSEGVYLLASKTSPNESPDDVVHAEMWLSDINKIINKQSYLGGIKRPCFSCANQLQKENNQLLVTSTNLNRPGLFFPKTLKSLAESMCDNELDEMFKKVKNHITSISKRLINDTNELKTFEDDWDLKPEATKTFPILVSIKNNNKITNMSFLQKPYKTAHDVIKTAINKSGNEVTVVIGDTSNRTESTLNFHRSLSNFIKRT